MGTRTLSRILLVEDETDIQAIVRLALETIGGFTVEVCSSGNEAISKVGEFSPDLILLDVMMPSMDGLSTFKALRALPQSVDTPIIFMTAAVQPRELAHYKEVGSLGVIPKPFDAMALPEIITDIWSQHHG